MTLAEFLFREIAHQLDGGSGLKARNSPGGDILDPAGDDVTAAKPAVDRRFNMARYRTRPSTWSFVGIAQTYFGRSGGFAPDSLPLFQGTRFGDVGLAITTDAREHGTADVHCPCHLRTARWFRDPAILVVDGRVIGSTARIYAASASQKSSP